MAVTKDKRRLVTDRAAADYLGVSRRTIRNWMSNGTLTAYRIGPTMLRFDMDEVEALVQPVTRAAAS